MRKTDEITNSEDLIDSRSIDERVDELRDTIESTAQPYLDTLKEEDADFEREASKADEISDALAEWLNNPSKGQFPSISDIEDIEAEISEYALLKALQDEGQGYSEWKYGMTLIRDSYFEEYAQQFAEDIGAIKETSEWPCDCIDWERAARELQMDYSAIEFDGVTYWMR